MTIKFFINYNTQFGEELFITGSSYELGNYCIDEALKLTYNEGGIWSGEIKFDSAKERILSYKYFVKNCRNEIYFEAGQGRSIAIGGNTKQIIAHDQWQGNDIDAPFLSAPFTQVFFGYNSNTYTQTHIQENELIIRVTIPNIQEDEAILISGNIPELGNWNLDKAVKMSRVEGVKWEANIQINSVVTKTLEYKFIKGDKWEEGDNHALELSRIQKHTTIIYEHSSSRFKISHPKFKGCAIPLFSLRSDESCGIGDFSDLKRLVDWSVANKMSVIQLLPINDTSGYLDRRDSYPYNCISVFALHPIYLNLKSMGTLKDEDLGKEIYKYGKVLNHLVYLDYEEVIELKTRFFKAIYKQERDNTFAEPGFYTFKKENKNWLYPYAVFCALRDENKSPDYGIWKRHGVFSKELMDFLSNPIHSKEQSKKFSSFTEKYGDIINYYIFLQYHAHKQMLEAKEYAHSKGVALKGDIPIGVARFGVDAWQYPQFFNFSMQAGAPPDLFSEKGQIWGFPTYRWDIMEQDNYSWWKERLIHMSKYFDAFRLDHVLGFFRIWEVPMFSPDSSSGHFYPVIPLNIKEIAEVLPRYNPAKMPELFVEYPYEKGTYHPAINALNSKSFAELPNKYRDSYQKMYYDFFYQRNENLWYENGKKKLQQLIAATDMLPCAEDLGMISDAIRKCLDNLKILSLKIGGDMSKYPYLSVCTTSTHDMETMRMQLIRKKYPELPKDLTEWIAVNKNSGETIPIPDVSINECKEIILKALASPSMLTILPMQDWLSMFAKYRSKYPNVERINDPSNPNHYWRYRMEISLEDLAGMKELE